MRHWNIPFTAALLALLLANVAQAATLVLIADPVKIEATSTVFARLRAQAFAAQLKRTGKALQAGGSKNAVLAPEYAEALESSVSDLRVALPELIASIARARKADMVLEPEVAKKFGLVGVDITAEVTKALDVRGAKTVFLAP
jgi:hypothetical protein